MNDFKGQAVIVIQAPPEVVYDYLVDFPRHAEWAQNIGKVTQVTPGPIEVGTTFKTEEGPPPVALGAKVKMVVYFMCGLLSGAKPYSEARITALEPRCRIAWQAGVPKGDGFFNFAEWEFVLAPRGSGTEVTQRFHWKPQSRTAERMVGAAGPDGLARAVGVSLAALKRRLETAASNGR
jgi:uncharacterized protein YndB with AHSA1/START domain